MFRLLVVTENYPQRQCDDVNNSYYSPASSCSSELAHHIPSVGLQSASHQGDSQSANLRSLKRVLSHSLPLAVDSINPSCRFPIPKLEKVSVCVCVCACVCVCLRVCFLVCLCARSHAPVYLYALARSRLSLS